MAASDTWLQLWSPLAGQRVGWAGGVRAQRRHHNFVNFDDVTNFSFEFNEINRRPRNYFKLPYIIFS